MMNLIGNNFWFVLGCAVMCISWWIAGVQAYLSIIGIPWSKACFVIGQFAFMPLGKEAVSGETEV